MGPGDAPELLAILGRAHAASRASGPVAYDEDTVRRRLAMPGDFCYIADDGFLVYRWSGDDLEVENLVAASEETARALWSLVGSSSSIATTVRAHLAPDDPVLWLLRERSTDAARQVRWMFRVLDVGDAVTRRGYPAGATLDAVVELDDPLREGNRGAWRLEISGGAGAALRSLETGPKLSINGFSALFCGIATTTLRRAGLMSGDDRYDEALDAAFAATPYMLDYF